MVIFSPFTILAILSVARSSVMTETRHRNLIEAIENQAKEIEEQTLYFTSSTDIIKKLALRKGCPSPWVLYKNLCLLTKGGSANTITWGEADTWCKFNGGYLPFFRNKKEYDDLYSFVKIRLDTRLFHIGLRTLRTQYPPNYVNWDSGLSFESNFLTIGKRTDGEIFYYSALVDKNNTKKYHIVANDYSLKAPFACRRLIREEI